MEETWRAVVDIAALRDAISVRVYIRQFETSDMVKLESGHISPTTTLALACFTSAVYYMIC